MAFQFAGRFGSETILGGALVLVPGRTVSVKVADTATLATIYTDRLKTATAANPVTVNARGNLTFLTEPGEYDLRLITDGVEGEPERVTVGADPLESDADLAAAISPLQDAIDALDETVDDLDDAVVHLAGAETISGVKTFTATPNVVFDGDSQSVVGDEGTALGPTTYGTGYAAQTVAGIDPRATLRNVAVSGQTVVTMTANAAANIDTHYDATKNNVVLMWGGTNDLINAPSFTGPFPDAATVYARIVAYHTARRAAGWKTVVFTILPRTQAFNSNYETDRLAINTLIRANWATFADALADVGGDTILGNAANLTKTAYFSDAVHVLWGHGGARIVAQHAKAALATLGIVTPNRPATDTMFANFIGSLSTALGIRALQSNTSGSSCAAFGFAALQSNTTGADNTAIGRDAMFSNTTGQDNTAVGMQALRSNTTGGVNVAMGLNALYGNTTGSNNVAIGVNALFNPGGLGSANATTTGLRQTALGYGTGQASATQRNDVVCVGYFAQVDADDSVAVGSGAKALHANAVAIGKGVVSTAANQVKIGATHIELVEITAPAAGATNSARLYAVDSGGKTQLAVIFPTGAVQVLATEP